LLKGQERRTGTSYFIEEGFGGAICWYRKVSMEKYKIISRGTVGLGNDPHCPKDKKATASCGSTTGEAAEMTSKKRTIQRQRNWDKESCPVPTESANS